MSLEEKTDIILNPIDYILSTKASDELKEVFSNLKKLAFLEKNELINTWDLLRAIFLTENSIGKQFLKELNIEFEIKFSDDVIEASDIESYIIEYDRSINEMLIFMDNERLYSQQLGVNVNTLNSELMILALLSRRYFYSCVYLNKNNLTYSGAKKLYNQKHNIKHPVYLPSYKLPKPDVTNGHNRILNNIFKFLPLDINIIKSICINGKIRYSLPSQLNDRLELRIQINKFIDLVSLLKNVSLEEKEKHVNNATIEQYNIFKDKYPEIETLPLDEFKKLTIFMALENQDLIAALLNEFIEKIPYKKELQNYIYNNFAVFSLTTNPFSSPMWAHYGNNYKGITLMFDLAHPCFYNENPDFQPYEVIYQPELYKIENLTDKLLINDNFIQNVCFFQKTEEWEYEAEWRIVKNISNLQFDEEKNIYLDDFPTDAIIGIIFGMNVDLQLKQETMNMLKNNEKSNHIIFFDLVINDDKLEYDIKLI